MVGGSSEPRRNIHIIGTKGEIFGNFEESKFYVSKIDPSPDAHIAVYIKVNLFNPAFAVMSVRGRT